MGKHELVKKDMVLKFESNLPPIRVMAVAENYAMVRRKGGVPFVIAIKHLVSLNRLDKS